jgi:hypothetical protein
MAITVKIWGSVIGGFNTQLFLAFTTKMQMRLHTMHGDDGLFWVGQLVNLIVGI